MSDTQTKIDNEIEALAEAMAKSTTDSKQLLFDTIMELGPEGLKKAAEGLSEDDQELLKSFLEDMTKSQTPDADKLTPKKVEVKQAELVTEIQTGSDDEDEKVMDESETEHPHQGGPKDNPLDGQVVKSQGEGTRGGKVIGHTKSGKPVYESGNKGHGSKGWSRQDHLDAHDLHVDKHIDASEKRDEGMNRDYSTTLEADRARHMSANPDRKAHQETANKHQEHIDFHAKKYMSMKKSETVEKLVELEEAEHQVDIDGDGKIAENQEKLEKEKGMKKALEEIVSMAKSLNMSKEEVVKAIKDCGDDLELAKGKMKEKMEAGKLESEQVAPKEEPTKLEAPQIVQKSIAWVPKNPIAANTLGRNTHYDVDAYIEKSEQEKQDTLKKGAYFGETAAEPLKKSEDQKLDINDMIEKGMDYSTDEIKRIEDIRDHKIEGRVVKSFHDEDIARALGMSAEDYKRLMGE